MSLRKQLDQELIQAKSEFMAMASVVDNALLQCVTALQESNVDMAQEAINLESEIMEYERLIERRCMLLLLYQQPVASDLRNVSAMLKMITEMRHLGNQAAEIATLVIANIGKIDYNEVNPLLEMAQTVRRMAYDAIHAYAVMDQELAKEAIDTDEKVDALFLEVKKTIVKGIKKDSFKPGAGVDSLMISKHLEKIGDYSVSIGAWTMFAITGQPAENFI